MTAKIQPGVKERAEFPRDGESVSLIVGYAPEKKDAVISGIQDRNGVVEDELYYNTLAVSIQEPHLESLVELDGITTIEIEGRWEPMNKGNFQSHPGSIR